jgi:transposase
LEIGILHRQGLSLRAIARQRQVGRETARKSLRAPERKPARGPPAPRPSKPDPFEPCLKMRIAEGGPAAVTCDSASARASRRRRCGRDPDPEGLAEQHPARPAPPILRFETPPGRPAQADRTAIRRGRNRLSVVGGTPGFGRLSFVRFADTERVDTRIAAQERVFDAPGGVPHRILCDA